MTMENLLTLLSSAHVCHSVLLVVPIPGTTTHTSKIQITSCVPTALCLTQSLSLALRHCLISLLSTLVLFLKSNSYAETGRTLKRSVSGVSHASGQSRQMKTRGSETGEGWRGGNRVEHVGGEGTQPWVMTVVEKRVSDGTDCHIWMDVGCRHLVRV